MDPFAKKVYETNYGINVAGDITKIDLKNIPYADLLAAGFPCQSFSKAGNQNGFEDKTKGTLFFHVKNILNHFYDMDRPIKYVLLENVRNLVSHNGGNTWRVIIDTLEELGYHVHNYPTIMSPTDLDPQIPQSRERVFIYAVHKKYFEKKDLPDIGNTFVRRDKNKAVLGNSSILENVVNVKYNLDNDKNKCINMWQELLDYLPVKPSFPIWGNYFLYDLNRDPENCPNWKKAMIERNQDFYRENQEFIDDWASRHNFWTLKSTYQKFEWQCQDEYNCLKDTILQFRPSGLRAKKPTFIPALVAINQIPIIYQNHSFRKLTPRECARLQSFPESFDICDIDSQAYKQFGNSVNVKVVEYVARVLLGVNHEH
jgi:DNA (cytosine-5)-methyltransferase 1